MKWLALVIAVTLAGCFESRGNPSPAVHHGVGSTLVAIGLYFTWAGSAAIGLGVIGGIACLFMPALAIFRGYLLELAALGLVTLLLGTSFVWLGNNSWLLAVVVGLLCVFMCIRYRKRLGKLLGLPKNKPLPLLEQTVKG